MILHTDGGARGNPGPGASGIILESDSGKILLADGRFLGICTNNEAEYKALILGLTKALELKADNLVCFLDSELVVKQLNGQYKVKKTNLKFLYLETLGLVGKFKKITFNYVPRSGNKETDKIVNNILDTGAVDGNKRKEKKE